MTSVRNARITDGGVAFPSLSALLKKQIGRKNDNNGEIFRNHTVVMQNRSAVIGNCSVITRKSLGKMHKVRMLPPLLQV